MTDHIRQLAAVRDKIGFVIVLRPYESLEEVLIEDERVVVKIRTAKVKDLFRGYRVLAHGTRLIQYTPDDAGKWRAFSMTLWDDVPIEPYEVGSHGGLSPEEYAARKTWEDDCYRPGNGSRLGQRDSADRQFQGYDYKNPVFYTTQSEAK